MRTIRIQQKDTSGCGIACVAMVSGSSYKQIKERAIALNILKAGNGCYTDKPDIRILLHDANTQIIGYWKKFKSWELLPKIAILGVNLQKSGNWHWVIFEKSLDSAYVIDPSPKIKSARRTDFGRLKPFTYLEIEK